MVAMSVNFYVHFCLIDCPNIPAILNTAPNEHKLLELLADINNNWYEIGLALQIPHNDLDNLKRSPDSATIKLSNVIHIWFTTQPTPVTWDNVITAVEGNIVKNKEIANKIRCHLDLPKK